MIERKNDIKKINESCYLCNDNHLKYRAIIRIIYNKHEEFKYWLSKEEILENLIARNGFEDYKEDKLEEDLKILEQYGNLIVVEDGRRIKTIEEFKKKSLDILYLS